MWIMPVQPPLFSCSIVKLYLSRQLWWLPQLCSSLLSIMNLNIALQVTAQKFFHPFSQYFVLPIHCPYLKTNVATPRIILDLSSKQLYNFEDHNWIS